LAKAKKGGGARERETAPHRTTCATGGEAKGSPIDGNLVGTTRFGSRTSGASKLRCRSMQQPMGERVPYLLGSGSSLRSHCRVPFDDGNSRGFRSRHLGCHETPARAKKIANVNWTGGYWDIANS
jgi:hypothetical protein